MTVARASRAVRDDDTQAFDQARRQARDARRSRRRWDVLLVVGLGGAIGTLLRFAVSEALPHDAGQFPWSTLLVNVVGCVAIGALLVMITETAIPHRLLRPFVAVGVLGGLTTFSTYAVDAVDLARAGHPRLAVLYLVGTVLVCLAAVLAGAVGARRIVVQ